MASRNLHEAFEQAERARRRSGAPGPQPPAKPDRSPERSAGRSFDLATVLRTPIAWAVLLSVFALGFLAGRGARPVEAGDGVGTPTVLAPGEVPRGSHGPRELVPTESLGDSYLVDMEVELDDLANQYTVQVVSYSRSDRNLRLAQDLVSHLAAYDFPVAPPQRVGDEYLVVLVGASPTREALAGLLARVRVLEDAAGQARFRDARILHIDKLLDRD